MDCDCIICRGKPQVKEGISMFKAGDKVIVGKNKWGCQTGLATISEIDGIIVRLTNGYICRRSHLILDTPYNNDDGYVATSVPSGDSKCNHEYKQYQGLIESYIYCTKCDKKD